MDIGYFVWEYPPRIVGGLGTYASEIVPALAKLGHRIVVFTPNDKKEPLPTRETVVPGKIEVHRPKSVKADILPMLLSEDIQRWGSGVGFFTDVLQHSILAANKSVNDLIEKEGYNFDLIAVHDWLGALAGIMVKQETGLPFVFHLHSTEWGRNPGAGSATVTKIEKTTGEIADRIITVSYPMQQDLISHGFDPGKIRVIWNGIDIDKYDTRRILRDDIIYLRNRYGIAFGEPMILFIGRLTGVKGVINLVKAMPTIINRYPGVKLVILGQGELQQAISDLVNHLGIKNRVVTRFEFVDEDERILHYGACDLFVAPSVYEPFGIIALEAMAMEKSIVVGARGTSGFRDFVTPSGPDQTGIHIDGNNSADIAWGINSLLDDMNAAKEMGKRGRKRVEQHFTWDKIAARTIEIYKEAIEDVKARK